MKPLCLAFIGYNIAQTLHYFEEFATLNRDEIEQHQPRSKYIRCYDGTVIYAVTDFRDFTGRCFDQVIIAVDRRGTTNWPDRQLDMYCQILLKMTLRVPDGFRVLFYDLDSKEV